MSFRVHLQSSAGGRCRVVAEAATFRVGTGIFQLTARIAGTHFSFERAQLEIQEPGKTRIFKGFASFGRRLVAVVTDHSFDDSAACFGKSFEMAETRRGTNCVRGVAQ